MSQEPEILNLRYGTQGGVRYVCRDVILKGRRISQSATWDDEVAWIPNKPYHSSGRTGEQGGFMYPFEGSDDVWEQITEGGVQLWYE